MSSSTKQQTKFQDSRGGNVAGRRKFQGPLRVTIWYILYIYLYMGGRRALAVRKEGKKIQMKIEK